MKRIYYILILSVILFSCEKTISPFQSQNFIKYFGSGYESRGNDIIQLADGNYIFTGYDKPSNTEYQIFVGKADKNGNSIWPKKLYSRSSSKKEGKIIKALEDGYLISGTVDSLGKTFSFLLKIDLDGGKSWINYNGGPNNDGFIVNDIVLNYDYIYLIGKSKSSSNNFDYYFTRIKYDGSAFENHPSGQDGIESEYIKGFIYNNDLVLIGTYQPLNNSDSNKVTVTPLQLETFVPMYAKDSVLKDCVPRDAILSSDQIYILSNFNGDDSLKILTFNQEIQKNIYSKPIIGVEGKSFLIREDGTLLVCGDQTSGLDSKIKFIKVGSDGIAGSIDEFRTFAGYAGKIIETSDKGIILVGTTSPASNGTMIQLIKTDRDLFLLKP